MSIAQNIQVGELTTGENPLAVVSMTQARQMADRMDEAAWRPRDRPGSSGHRTLGGNQQKVVIAKSLIQKPKLVIFDEPTRGVDVGAIVEIHRFINELADDGIAVVVISSYLPEVLALSDRILVARQGRIVEEMDLSEATEAKIMYAAVH